MKVDKSEERYITVINELKEIRELMIKCSDDMYLLTGKTRKKFFDNFIDKILKFRYELEDECYQKYKTEEYF